MIMIVFFTAIGPYLGYILIGFALTLIVWFAVSWKEENIKEQLAKMDKIKSQKLSKNAKRVIREDRRKFEQTLVTCRVLRWICLAIILAIIVFCIVLVCGALSVLNSVFSGR